MSIEDNFNCINAAQLVCESRDRELNKDELSLLQLHVVSCPECQVARKQLEDLFNQVDELLTTKFVQ